MVDLSAAELETAARAAVTSCRHFPVPAELRDLARPTLAPGRKPEDDYDPIGQWKRDQDEAHRLGTGPRLLPERIVSPEQAAQRATRFAALKAETVAQMQAAAEQHRANARVRQSRRRLARAGWVTDDTQSDAARG